MNTNNLRLLAALAVAALMGISNSGAQGGGFGGGGGRGGGGGFGAGGGGFDMASILQMAVDNLREPFEVKDDGEWKVIGDQIHKVLEARLQAETSGGGLMGLTRAFGRRPQGGGGGGNQGGAGNQDNNNQGGGRRRNFNAATAFGGTQDPTMEALQKAIDDNASTADLKAAVAKYVEARKMRQAKLEAAQTDLRKLLSVRQEAIAYSFGLL